MDLVADFCGSSAPVSRLFSHIVHSPISTLSSKLATGTGTSCRPETSYPDVSCWNDLKGKQRLESWGKEYAEFEAGADSSVESTCLSILSPNQETPQLQTPPLAPPMTLSATDWDTEGQEEFSTEWNDDAFTMEYLRTHPPDNKVFKRSYQPSADRCAPLSGSIHAKPPFPLDIHDSPSKSSFIDDFLAKGTILAEESPENSCTFEAQSEDMLDAESSYWATHGKRSDWNWDLLFGKGYDDNTASGDGAGALERDGMAEVSRRRLRLLISQLGGGTNNSDSS